MKNTALLLIALLALSCNKKTDNVSKEVIKDTVSTSNFKMYDMSEMAALMEQMYAHNTQLKERILNKEDLGTYPVAFDKIHTAILTESSDRDAFFNEQAIKFIALQKAIYADTVQAKENYNKMVNQCLECHSKKCGGPIPRIKKLLIP
ncbi:hypothetical protein P3875_06000 [Myroides sp. JBRI-B21084]|uniref:hypothetical protein n=1 Tax=Myroides sp. JBRI-B21084 TaxID=3119977 RepID=UPI0026E3E975|nr:hypothetical protein [Paenimyroides cloacae]WKW47605.1 hypothetical protein P3875_06000 [Paenimyroides cloacae]